MTTTNTKPIIPVVPSSVVKSQRIDWLAYKLKRFCVLPWINLNTNPNGNIKLCCSIQTDTFVSSDNKPFNLGKDDISDIWNSFYMQHVRGDHRSNVSISDCKECYNIEIVSGHSPRTGQNAAWLKRKESDWDLREFFQSITDENPLVTLDQLPVSLELRLGNQCNLKCVTCWGMSSSLIQNERIEIIKNGKLKEYNLQWLDDEWKKETEVVEQSKLTEWYETDMFYSNFRKMAPYLKRLYTTGGEPTIIKANYKALEMLLEAGNNSCSIEFTSNMTTWNKKFYDALAQFEEVEIQMSIDGVDETGEFIRYPSNFAIVKENMFKAGELVSKNSNWRIKCYTVLQALNYDKITEIWDLLDEIANKYQIHIDWWPITLAFPSFLSLSAIPLEKRIKCAMHVETYSKKFEDPNKPFPISKPTIEVYINSLKNIKYSETINQQYDNYIKFLIDNRRNDNG